MHVKFQLDEIETQEKTYPETNGFLNLLHTLVTYGIPSLASLSSNPQAPPSFAPFMEFVLKDVFAKLDTRQYIKEEEKWQLAKNSLRVFLRIFETYTPSLVDFSNAKDDFNPGAALMRDMLSNTPLQAQVFQILKKGVEKFENMRHLADYGNEYEECVLLCLQLVDSVLLKQDAYFEVSLNENKVKPALVSHLDKRLMSTYLIVDVAQYIGYRFRAEIRLYAVRILYSVSGRMQDKIFPVFRKNERHFELRQMILERICDDTLEYEPEHVVTSESEQIRELLLENQVRQTLLDLLISNVSTAKNNITFFLCGINEENPEASGTYNASLIFNA